MSIKVKYSYVQTDRKIMIKLNFDEIQVYNN